MSQDHSSRNTLVVAVITAVTSITGTLISSGAYKDVTAEAAPTTQQATAQPANDAPNTFRINYYDNEEAAHKDIEQDLLKSKKVKLYLVRGSKLFQDDDGLFFLKKYKKKKINPLQSCQVLLLDFNALSMEQYGKITENVNLKWNSLEGDAQIQNNTVNTINALGADFNIEAKLYQASDFQYFKMFIFDEYCYFTIYHKVGNAKEHQEYRMIRARYGDPMYEALESIFETNWEKARKTK